MTTGKRRNEVQRLMAVVLTTALVAGSAPALDAQATSANITRERVRNALVRLSEYGVFDFLAFEIDRGTVTLLGYAYRSELKEEAGDALRDVRGVDEIGNRIEVLPASQNDDRIRWATFYNIYTDSFLSRYAPGGAESARDDYYRFSRYPGTQPYGSYAIHIIVNRGRTILHGVVGSETDKVLAGVKAREIPGVFGVENALVVSGS